MASTHTAVAPDDDIRRAKQQMRKAIALLSASISEHDVNEQSKAITENVLNSSWYKDCARISVFVSTKGEVDTSAIIGQCIADGKQLFIPNFQRGSNRMEMLRLRSLAEYLALDATLWGIRQHSTLLDELSWRHSGPLDVVLLPGVAFTKEGLRLGHGKGFYDRFLTEHREVSGAHPRAVGLALRYQLCESVPITDRDVPLDDVISP